MHSRYLTNISKCHDCRESINSTLGRPPSHRRRTLLLSLPPSPLHEAGAGQAHGTAGDCGGGALAAPPSAGERLDLERRPFGRGPSVPARGGTGVVPVVRSDGQQIFGGPWPGMTALAAGGARSGRCHPALISGLLSYGFMLVPAWLPGPWPRVKRMEEIQIRGNPLVGPGRPRRRRRSRAPLFFLETPVYVSSFISPSPPLG
ncbi:uncharacterized protein LOC125554391 [Triticum urartu]|uniref:uncharacterized protein LOC125554391 n=1 Tax=Triticum urartu TaxID=4572 RepID=UPI00204358BB|nr:uncharacterized protein LOC125554391 [Triticum urartu]